MTHHHPPSAGSPHSGLTAPSLKDLLRRTRSPLRMTHPRPTALSKKAGTLPIRFFSWSAASLATIAALFSYGSPAFGHHFRYRDIVAEPGYSWRNHPLRGSIVPICTSEEIKSVDNSRSSRGYYRLDNLTQGVATYALGFIGRDGNLVFFRHCHGGENNPPIITTQDIAGPLGQILDLINNPIVEYDLNQHFNDPDGDELTYTAVSSDTSKVRATVSGSKLTIGAVGIATLQDGGVSITVTADDGKGGTVSNDFLVRVELGSDNSEVIEDVTEEVAKEVAEKKAKDKAIDLAKKNLPKLGKVIGKANPYVGAVIGLEQLIKNREGIVEIFTDIGKGLGLTSDSSSGSSNEQLNSLAENLYIHHEALQNGNISLDQAFSGQRFYVPFSLAQTDSKDQESSPRFNALLSADIGFSRFSDSSDPDLSIDGTTTNYGIGLTLLPNPEVPLITGLQFGYTRSNSDFEHTEMEGTYNLRMFSVSPYIAWDATDSLTVWSAIGYGRPNDEITIESVDGVDFDSTEDSTFTSSGDFFSFAGGANYRVWESNLSALSIGLSGSTTSFLDNDSKEGSISAQFSHNFPLNTGQLKTSADLALILSDSGPSATELSGNLNWLPNQGRLSGSTNARVLLFGGDRSEWGIGGSVTLLPGERGEGLSLALRPSFGQTNTSLSSLHLDPFSFSDPTELAISTAPLTARFNAELAYGFPTGNHALLTPYIDAHLAHNTNTYTTGLRYQLDSGLDLDLSASHRTRSSGNNDNRFFLQLRSDL